MQKKILVYGTGALTQKYLLALSLEFEILGFVQTEGKNFEKTFYSKPVVSARNLSHWDYDLIVICSNAKEDIQRNLLQQNINSYVHVDDLSRVIALASDIAQLKIDMQRSILENMAPPALSDKHINRCKLLANRDELLKHMKPNSIAAELGVAAGEYSSQIIDTVSPQKLHLIDLWSSERFNENQMSDVEAQFSVQIASGQVQMHRSSSFEAASSFHDGYFDWVYIDTDHSYQTTLTELRLYKNKIKPDGFLMGHDYSMGNWKKHLKYGVIEAVHQFCVEEEYELAYLTMELNQSFAIRRLSNPS